LKAVVILEKVIVARMPRMNTVRMEGRLALLAQPARWALLLLLVIGLWPRLPVYAQTVTPQTVTPQGVEQATVSPTLLAQLAASPAPVEILIVLRAQPDPSALHAVAQGAAEAAAQDAAARRIARLTAVYAYLTAQATATQADLRAWLADQGVAYRPFYIVNMIQVRGNAALVAALSTHPDVARLDADPQIDLRHALGTPAAPWLRQADAPDAALYATAVPQMLYGLNATRAPELWAAGYTGQGIVVAGQDTGVQWDHPALVAAYRGRSVGADGIARVDDTYNWLDAVGGDGADSSVDPCAALLGPCDDNGHGTHTVGTMVGQVDDQIYGMAPAAQWIGCRNMLRGVGTPASYTTCFEFLLAPYPQGGDPFTDGRPELAPHVINNSWGCPPSEGCNADSLRQVVETVRTAGIMVVASAGNKGLQGCESITDPIAIYDASTTVGAHDRNGQLAGFSSLGPVTADGSGRIKPDLTAPGVAVYSATRGGGYTTLSGTSMAAPHVAGAVALLWSAVPELIGDVDLTEQVLIKSAVPVIDSRCGAAGATTLPNVAYGYGRLDVVAALALAQHPWTVALTVTGQLSQPVGLAVTHPISGAVVSGQDLLTGFVVSTTTRADGTAAFSALLDGDYALVVTAGEGISLTTALTLTGDTLQGHSGDATLRLHYAAQARPSASVPVRLFFPIFLATDDPGAIEP
jgi:subtilisin family serine protease